MQALVSHSQTRREESLVNCPYKTCSNSHPNQTRNYRVKQYKLRYAVTYRPPKLGWVLSYMSS